MHLLYVVLFAQVLVPEFVRFLSFLQKLKNICQQVHAPAELFTFHQSTSVRFLLYADNTRIRVFFSVADVAAVVYYLREDKLWSQTVSSADGQVGRATEVRSNNGTIRAFDVDYNRQLIYWIDNQNKVSL